MRLSLENHTKPRILAIDFTAAQVQKLTKLGYDAKRGAGGLHDNEQFLIPFAVQDVEIFVAIVEEHTFFPKSEYIQVPGRGLRVPQAKRRKPHKNSVVKGAYFGDIVKEVWAKWGWSIIFVKPSCPPTELSMLEISDLGVIPSAGSYMSATHSRPNSSRFTPALPLFKGQSIHINEEEPEAEILKRYVKNTPLPILACDKQVKFFGGIPHVTWLLKDDSTKPNALAIKAREYGYEEDDTEIQRAILLLPDLGNRNIDFVLSLLDAVIPEANPNLFDAAENPWLSDYFPNSVKDIIQAKKDAETKHKVKLASLDKKQQEELDAFGWLTGLLISKDDEFNKNVHKALEFLGFSVEDIDQKIKGNAPKKEDLHISDPSDGFFSLGESKSTNRGANLEHITKTQVHQNGYAREHKTPPPPALLIINHNTKFDPKKRAEKFYTDKKYQDMCEINEIMAVCSYALHQMCQAVLSNKVNKDVVRNDLKKAGVIATYNT